MNDKQGELIEKIVRDIKSSVSLHKRWREEARRAYRFVEGDQYEQEDMEAAEIERRAMIVFNRLAPVIDAVVGMEAGNRHEIKFGPTEVSDSATNDLLGQAVKWATNRCHEPFHTADAFRDLTTCGLGVTGVRLNYEEDPDGKICVDRIDPLSYLWDTAATARNLVDRRWDATIKLVDHEELEALFGEDAVEGLTLDDDVWKGFLTEDSDPHNADPEQAYNQIVGNGDVPQRIPLVEYEYYKRMPFYRVQFQDGLQEVEQAEFKAIKAQLDEQGIPYVKQTRRRFFRVFLAGDRILEDSPAPCKDAFSRKVMTGKRSKSTRGWHGMVRAMIGMTDCQGPQQMTNKLYSESINSIATQSKGGLLAEVDAFVDSSVAQDQWAASDSIVWLKPGGLAKVTPKPLGEYPQGMDRLLQWAVQSVPEVTGVNWELLGLVNRDQPGIVEDSRRQAAITILAEYFDALKMYRAELGNILAAMIIEYMAGDDEQSSRLIRLSGEGSEQVVPLLKSNLTLKYDVMIDESPSSANTKDKTWAVLVDLVPMAVQMGMPPPPDFLEYAPIPSALAQKWLQSIQAAQQPAPPDPAMQALMAGEARKAETAATLNEAKTQESVAKAAQIQVETQLAPQDMQLRAFETVQAAQQPQQPPEVNDGRGTAI